jgi:leader peptidase (prepilin peptidase)/N-methyltransferase
MDDVVLVAALAAVACGLAGLLVPTAIARLPEPPPDAERAELEVKALDGPLTAREQRRLDEGPKPLYVDVAATPHLGPVSGLVSAVVAVLVVVAVGADLDLALLLPLVPVGVLLAVVDLHTRMLPRLVVSGAVVVALVVVLVLWLAAGDLDQPDQVVRTLTGLALGFALFFVIWFVYPPGMGYGDVRLAGLCGLVLAHQGWAPWAVGLYSAFLLFGVPGVLLAVVRRDAGLMKHHFPFGPFLLVGIVVGLLAGGPVADRLAAG